DPKNSADADHEKPSKAKVKEKKPEDPDKLKKAIVQVMYQGQLARLVLNKRGLSGDEVWIKFEESGETESVPCKEISGIVAVIEG
ncbi:transcriptional repressor KorB C-terminal beta-barrel domain-containing protein, partial [Neisseria gonorrhoeae]